jgi:hypothetical protein
MQGRAFVVSSSGTSLGNRRPFLLPSSSGPRSMFILSSVGAVWTPVSRQLAGVAARKMVARYTEVRRSVDKASVSDRIDILCGDSHRCRHRGPGTRPKPASAHRKHGTIYPGMPNSPLSVETFREVVPLICHTKSLVTCSTNPIDLGCPALCYL